MVTCVFEKLASFLLLSLLSIRFEGHQLEEQPGVEVRQQQQRQKDPSLVIALVRTFGTMFIVAAFFKLLQDALQFVSPQILK